MVSKKKNKKKTNELSERAKDSLWFGKKGETLQEVHTSHIHLPMKSPTDQNHSLIGNLKHAPQKVQKVSHPHSSIVPKFFYCTNVRQPKQHQCSLYSPR